MPLTLMMQSGSIIPISIAHFIVSFPTRFAIVASDKNFLKTAGVTLSPS